MANKKQELLNQIEVLKKQVEQLDTKPEFSIIEDWMKPNVDYFTIDFDNDGDIEIYEFGSRNFGDEELDDVDESLINFGLAFQTQDETRDFRHWLQTRNTLAKLAKFLNNGVEIDWHNENQTKHVIYFVFGQNANRGELFSASTLTSRSPFEVYCLDPKFLDKAIEVVGRRELEDFYIHSKV